MKRMAFYNLNLAGVRKCDSLLQTPARQFPWYRFLNVFHSQCVSYFCYQTVYNKLPAQVCILKQNIAKACEQIFK